MHTRISHFAVGAALLAGSAWAESLPERSIDFAVDIHPILVQHCYECHGQGQRKGGFQMNTREQLLQGTPFGAVVVPGNGADSLLFHVVTAEDPADRMPPDGAPLSEREIGLLRAWIDEGLPWSEHVAAHTDYVAPLTLDDSPPPAVLPGGTGHLVDRYLDAYLSERNLRKPAPVDERRFARRAWLDATGLLPTPAEYEAFRAQEGRNKRADLVNKLLADDNAYAEHWMSFWNDHLRNDFEGTGYIDGGRRQITGWLYEALRNNKPYDTFVRELVAPPDSRVEGFIRGIVWRGDNATVQLPSMQAAGNVSQVFLGVNMKCASCHDSFVDDWTLRDAFNFANVFSEEPMELVRCDTATGEMADYGFLWPEVGGIDGSQPRKVRMAQAADLVTSENNAHFARTIVNRVWAVLMGRGFVEPLDAIEREPWHGPLLDALARDFVERGHDMKHLIRTIMTSEAYQWPAVPREEQDDAEYVFTGPEVRRLTAEQFYDALGRLTGVWQANPLFALPEETTAEAEAARQARLAAARAGGRTAAMVEDEAAGDGPARPVRAWRVASDPLMTALGRPNREQVTTRRENAFTTLQALELSNGETLATYLAEAAPAVRQAVAGNGTDLVEHLYRAGLNRAPRPEEQEAARMLAGDEPDDEAVADLLWILAVSPEFQIIY